MGGRGSGPRPKKRSVAECAVLDIARLCGGGRWLSQPQGAIALPQGNALQLAQLPYRIVPEPPTEPARQLDLVLDYPRSLRLPAARVVIALSGGAGKPFLGRCPAQYCWRTVRKLYLVPGGARFICRHCLGLVYRYDRNAARVSLDQAFEELLPDEQRAASQAQLRVLQEALLRRLAAELPLGPEELRLYCQRLAETGLSVRQIAALVHCSKSSVQRYVAAGFAGLDEQAFVHEREQRYLERRNARRR